MKKIPPDLMHTYREPFIDPAPKFTEADYKLINDLFVVFQSIFPAFKQAWPTQSEFENSKREWIKAFKLVNLCDLETIKIGVNKFRLLENPFVPSPGQFIAMCKPEVSLVPPMYRALPSPDVDLDKQREEMKKVRERLGVK
jgi:hypothetical protein